MISPFRFIRRLMQLPGNIERIAERAANVDNVSSALHHLHGEVRALRLDAQEREEITAATAHEKKILLGTIIDLLGQLEKWSAALPASQQKIIDTFLSTHAENNQKFSDILEVLHAHTERLEHLSQLSSIIDILHVHSEKLDHIPRLSLLASEYKDTLSLLRVDTNQKLADIIEVLQTHSERFDFIPRMNALVTDIKNNTDDLRKGGFLTQVEENTERVIASDARAKDSRWLGHFEYQVFSQNGEDGVIEEILKRIGAGSKTFMEIGVSDGLECNTTALLLKGWNGYWIEQDPTFAQTIREKFEGVISQGRLRLIDSFATAENIEELISKANVPQDIDLLSIDIDGNDYWIWKAMESIKPRAVVIEYNAVMKPPIDWVMTYNPDFRWNGSRHYGASLLALQKLAEQKGYALVGCEVTGNNAFFVRKDLVHDNFMQPFTAATHYQPPRYYLVHTRGHKRDFGEFVQT